MAYLKVLRGADAGRHVSLKSDRTLFGRQPTCQVILDDGSVSRQHAQITESHGQYYVEDLRSRNGTFVNDKPVAKPTQLADGDIIRICEFLYAFYEIGSSSDLHNEMKFDNSGDESAARETLPNSGVMDDDLDERSSIISKLDASSASHHRRLNVKPEVKLRALLEIGKNLRHALKIDDLLPKILESLFQIFPQADQGFVLLTVDDDPKPRLRAMKNRHQEDDSLSISQTIINRAMKTGEAILSADASEDSRFMGSKSLAGLRIRSMMCVPLVAQSGDRLGVIQITTYDLRSKFNDDDLDLLVSIASQCTIVIENAHLHAETMKQRDLQRELEFAMQVQLGFLPNKKPQQQDYEFANYYEAAQHVGGDYYDYVEMPNGSIAVTVADVAGKGVPAALLMARLYSAARYHLLTKPTLAQAMTGLNAEITTSGLGHRFITCAMLILDPRKHEVTYVNAGHLPPLRRDLDGKAEYIDIDEAGLPLGIIHDQEFKQVVLPMHAGDTWLLYTDGVTEAMNPAKQIYGTARFKDFVKSGPLEVDELIKGVIDDVNKFVTGRAQSDDLCIVGFQRNP